MSSKALGKRRMPFAQEHETIPSIIAPAVERTPACMHACSNDAALAVMLQAEADEEARIYWANQHALRNGNQVPPTVPTLKELQEMDDDDVDDLFGDDDENMEAALDMQYVPTEQLRNLHRDETSAVQVVQLCHTPVHEFHHTTATVVPN